MKSQRFDVIVTVSKQISGAKWIQGFLDRGATIFRINGSHTTLPNARSMIRRIRSAGGRRAKILIDLPGSKVRLRHLAEPLHVHEGKPFHLTEENFNYPELPKLLKKEHMLIANDGTLAFQLVKSKGKNYVFVPHVSGVLRSGKGLNIMGEQPPIPFLGEFDFKLIDLALTQKIDYIGFSYIRSPRDVLQANSIVSGTRTQAICKVETREACDQLHQIIPLTDTILIDRGDLSSEIGIHEIPKQVKRIIRIAKRYKKKIFAATQFLFYMVHHPIPSISEIVTLHETLADVNGLQLSEETAIGEYPFKALEVIQEALSVIKRK